MEFIYFNVAFAINIHDNIINQSGGRLGVINAGLLDSTLVHIQNDQYYPELEDKITYLIYSINKNHCFLDGNKRASLALAVYFLEINNLSQLIEKFILNLENIVVDVANNIIDRDLLHEIVTSLIYEDDYSEELKLKIYHAKNRCMNNQ